MASYGIGAKLRQERLGLGLTIADISHDTRIAPRFLEAIETDNFESLPGHLFARNFVRQYALSVKLDPDPLLAGLPKPDEGPLPEPPSRSLFHTERPMHSALASGVWIVLAAGAAIAAYVHFSPSAPAPPASSSAPLAQVKTAGSGGNESTAPRASAPVIAPAQPPATAPAQAPDATPVHVVLAASQRAWIQMSVDGKVTFTGTLAPAETKEISAASEIKLTTGNAGALSVSLNGKVLQPLGSIGQVRVVKLTAEGLEFLAKAPPPPLDVL